MIIRTGEDEWYGVERLRRKLIQMTSFENVREIRGKMQQNGNLKSGGSD